MRALTKTEMLLQKGSRISTETGDREKIPAGPVNQYGEIDYELSAQAEEGWFFPVSLCVKSKFNQSYKDIEDEKFNEVVEYIEFLKNNPS